MKLPLSPRLHACCSFITPGDRVADVGTDHGYLGIWLLQKGLASHVIASDIGEGPLSAAKNNAARFGFADKMTFCLSDGVQNVPRDFNTLVIAGMGAQTMVHILENGPWLPGRKLILQPQNKPHLLRAWLSENGWHIRRETLVRDGRFLYAVMEAVHEPAEPLTPGQCWLSPALLGCGQEELAEYRRRTLRILHDTALGDPSVRPALEELKQENCYDHC